MAKPKRKGEKTFTYPQLLEKYFPGDTAEMDEESEEIDTSETNDAFFELLRKITRISEPESSNDKSRKPSEA